MTITIDIDTRIDFKDVSMPFGTLTSKIVNSYEARISSPTVQETKGIIKEVDYEC